MTRLQGPEYSQEERLKEMIHLYEKSILRVCYLYLHDVELARDAVQDTFLKAYTHLDSQREPEKEKSWLTAIAANVCRDYLRSAWVRHTDRFVRPEDLPAAVNPPGEEHMLLTAAIMNLPPKYAEILLPKYPYAHSFQPVFLKSGSVP